MLLGRAGVPVDAGGRITTDMLKEFCQQQARDGRISRDLFPKSQARRDEWLSFVLQVSEEGGLVKPILPPNMCVRDINGRAAHARMLAH